ncbi:MAG: glycogen debranching N-terminal domain-containing protein, partial [Spirochaetia bacterium]
MRNRTILKEDYSFIVAGDTCDVTADADGFYWKDTRYLREYRWEFTEKYNVLSRWEDYHDRVEFILSWFDDPSQHIGITRQVTILKRGFTDSFLVENTDLVDHRFAADLHLQVDFSDVFIARGFESRAERSVLVTPAAAAVTFLDELSSDELVVRYRADGPASISWNGDTIQVRADLAPRETIRVSVTTEVVNRGVQRGDERFAEGPELPVTRRWLQRLDEHRAVWQLTDVEYRVARQAATDLRALLLASPDGIIPAAGIPWFAAAFGRDSIITSIFAKALYPELIAGTLQFLAHHQGRETNDFRAEAPGKIMHELRFGELTRSGRVPYSPYYGTVDATPLFVILVGEALASGESDIGESIEPAVAGALRWMESDGDGNGDGFLDYESGAHDGGLTVQSWKDSGESMSHRDGS